MLDVCLIIKDVREENTLIPLVEKADYIFHFAALVGVTRTQDKPLEVLSDIEGFKNILSISLKYKVKRIFFSSSSEVYGNNTKTIENRGQ